MNLSINFCGCTFATKFSLFHQLQDKIAKNQLNISFLETLVIKFCFYGNILTSRKKSGLFASVSIENYLII